MLNDNTKKSVQLYYTQVLLDLEQHIFPAFCCIS